MIFPLSEDSKSLFSSSLSQSKSMDTAQWPQGTGVVKAMDGTRPLLGDQRKTKPEKDQVLNCPRCNSTNTKFCYYNNYSLSQPRYFCKTCRRYWTEGGSLRNVPFGGGSRKNKRFSTSSTSTIPSFSNSASQNPKIHQGQDLNLSYPSTDHHHDYNTNLSKFIEFPPNPSSSTSNSSHFSAMEHLKSGHNIIASSGLSSSFMPMAVSDNSNNVYSPSGFPMQDFKPTLNFSLDGFENGYGSSVQGVQQNGGSGSSARLLFPFQELKQVTSTTEFDHNRSGNGDSTGYWINGMLGGGSW